MSQYVQSLEATLTTKDNLFADLLKRVESIESKQNATSRSSIQEPANVRDHTNLVNDLEEKMAEQMKTMDLKFTSALKNINQPQQTTRVDD
jgi:retron-type reverse transcriptase